MTGLGRVLQARESRNPAFYYQFAHAPPFPKGSAYEGWGPSHFSELWYVFDHLGQQPAWRWTPEDRWLADVMSGYWGNFVKTGEPNGPGLPRWPRFDPTHDSVLRLDDPIAVTGVPNLDKLQAFDAAPRLQRRTRGSVRGAAADSPPFGATLPRGSTLSRTLKAAQQGAETMVVSKPTRREGVCRHGRRRPVVLPDRRGDRGAGDAQGDPGAGVQACRRCELCGATPGSVPGEGPADAPLMLVGEQPGDMEDLAGRPFVGPAGQLLDRALAEAGIARDRVFVTNAVKHFKHETRGKRRLHKTPDAGEISACRWWLDNERRLVRPRVTVALGGSAALAVFGRAMPIMKSRGRPVPLEGGALGMVTVHPSYLLRVPDAGAKAAAYRDFVNDLMQVARLLEKAGAGDHGPPGSKRS